MKQRFESGLTFPAYLETVEKNADLWKGVYERATVPEELETAAREIPGSWHLLVLSEDWCGDAANILPVLARLTEAVPNLDLRVLSRDGNLDLMDAHLTNGKSRSIPVVMVLDEAFEERAWWGPRPSELQEWVMTEGLKLEPGPRYKHTRSVYARDKGRTILEEVIAAIVAAR
ncbi:MAG: thioredoxin family protein [Longimicrobiales bacterium]